MSGSAAPKEARKIDLSGILTPAVQSQAAKRTQAQQKPADEAKMADNKFAKILLGSNSSPEEKRAQLAAVLSYAGTKQESRETVKQLQEFEEHLQSIREKMASEIIELTDTEAMGELKSTYDAMNRGLLEFDERMAPLTDTLDALFTLRTNGVALNIFQEIQADRKAEGENNEKLEEKRRALAAEQKRLKDLEYENISLAEQKGLFGLGSIKQAARQKMAQNEATMTSCDDRIKQLEKDIADLDALSQSSGNGKFAAEKAKLRELLDISTAGHQERQRGLVDAATDFIRNGKERLGSVRSHLGQMGEQIDGLVEANSNMLRVYAIMNEGIKDAAGRNLEILEGLEPPTDTEEGMIAKIGREEKKSSVEEHVTSLDACASSALSTLADLTSQSIRIGTMRKATESQSTRAREMHSKGVAGVAERLSVVLQAVSNTALSEASAVAKDTLVAMTKSTNDVAMKESVRVAMGIQDTNTDLEQAINDLAAYGEVMESTTKITRAGVAEMRTKLDELRDVALSVRDGVAEASAINADAARGAARSAPDAKTMLDMGS